MNCTHKTRAALCRRASLLCILLLLPGTFLAAQAPAPPPRPDPAGPPPPQQEDVQTRIRVTTSLVVVPVIVKDAAGRIVPDLTRDEFRILEDDVEQHIDVFSSDPFPLSVVLLIDNDLETRVAEQVAATLPTLAAGFSRNDEVCIARFDQFFYPGKGFTSDPDVLLTQLQRVSVRNSPAPAPAGGPLGSGPKINGIPAPGASQIPSSARILKGQPTKAVDDAVYAAAQLLKDRGRDRRKLIFLISDGVNSKHNSMSFDDTVRSLLTAGISVYGLGVGNAFFNRRLTALSKFAHATGGDVFYAAQREDLERLYSAVSEEARNQYTLAYTPRGTDRSLDYHSVEIRVKRPGLSVLARDGYFAGLP
ncbi:MAG: VWA domain-containing protein [Acidobacteriia bacterium]|nr:VWA domain-containing protein [Terriglobia bacterium]